MLTRQQRTALVELFQAVWAANPRRDALEIHTRPESVDEDVRCFLESLFRDAGWDVECRTSLLATQIPGIVVYSIAPNSFAAAASVVMHLAELGFPVQERRYTQGVSDAFLIITVGG